MHFSVRSIPTDEIVLNRIFTIENEEVRTDGKDVIEHYLATDHSGLGFITAAVYRTDAVQLALSKWSRSVNNLEGQTYWTAFCAAQGSIKITKETYVEYASGMLFDAKPKIWFKMLYADIIEVYTKLSDIGYSEKLCRQIILKHFVEKNNWKVVLGALRRWPILAIKTIIPYLVLVSVSAGKYLFSSSVVEASTASRK